MKTKMVEIRDDCTMIMALAIKTEGETEQEKQFWGRGCGFSNNSVILTRFNETETQHDPFAWQNYRTMKEAHRYIQKHFDELPDYGAVIDVEYIIKETTEPKTSDIWGKCYE